MGCASTAASAPPKLGRQSPLPESLLQPRPQPIKFKYQTEAPGTEPLCICRVRSFPLLTESEVQRSFRNLFKTKDVSADTFEKAEALLDELRAESPLRHRLSVELEDIRKLHTAKV